MATQRFPVVGGKNDERVVRQPQAFEVIDDAPTCASIMVVNA